MPKDTQSRFQENITSILTHMGEDVKRDGLIDTPRRVYDTYSQIFSGYGQDPKELLQKALFTSDNKNMIVVGDIDFFSTCEHHMLPIIGKAFIGYNPNEKVVGLSKIPRLVDLYAKRLQIQENMTDEISNALMEYIDAKGVGVVIKARHLCMEMRGVGKIGSITTTFSYKGNFTDSNIRREFLEQVNI